MTRRERAFMRGWSVVGGVYKKSVLARRQEGMCTYIITIEKDRSKMTAFPCKITVELACNGKRTLIVDGWLPHLQAAKLYGMRATLEHEQEAPRAQ